jgi:hypothetical protein
MTSYMITVSDIALRVKYPEVYFFRNCICLYRMIVRAGIAQSV